MPYFAALIFQILPLFCFTLILSVGLFAGLNDKF